MGKLRELQSTSHIVKEILEKFPEARNSDNVLYVKVCAEIGNANGIDINKMSMPHFLLHLKNYNMPMFETVRRARQKIQAEHKHLAANADVEAQRMLNEDDFKNYARGYC